MSSPSISYSQLVSLFNTFIIIAIASLTIVVSTAHFSSTVKRNALWFRHLLAWIVYSVSYVILIGHQLDPTPPFGLCMVQAALIYAAPTFPTLSALCFVVDLYIGLSAVVHRKRKIRPAMWRFLLHFPLLVWVLIFLGTLVTVQNSEEVTVDSTTLLYCHLNRASPAKISAAIVVCTGLLIVPLEIWIAVVLCRNWVAFRRSASENGQDPSVSLTMFIRVALFTVLSLTGVGLSSFSLFKSHTPYWSLTLSIVPILAAVIFGSQTDLMKCYVFWREPEPVSSSTSQSAPKESAINVTV